MYSLGNFLFHPYDGQVKENFVARMEINLLGEVRVRLYPILLNDGTVTLLTGEQANHISQTLINRSYALGTELVRQGDYLVVSGTR